MHSCRVYAVRRHSHELTAHHPIQSIMASRPRRQSQSRILVEADFQRDFCIRYLSPGCIMHTNSPCRFMQSPRVANAYLFTHMPISCSGKSPTLLRLLHTTCCIFK